MKLTSWIIAGISAITATTIGVFSFSGGGNVVASVSSENSTQSSSVNRGLQSSSSSTNSRGKIRTLSESLKKYSECRRYSISCKSFIPKESNLYDFLV